MFATISRFHLPGLFMTFLPPNGDSFSFSLSFSLSSFFRLMAKDMERPNPPSLNLVGCGAPADAGVTVLALMMPIDSASAGAAGKLGREMFKGKKGGGGRASSTLVFTLPGVRTGGSSAACPGEFLPGDTFMALAPPGEDRRGNGRGDGRSTSFEISAYVD